MSGELDIIRTQRNGIETVRFQGEITAENAAQLTAGVAEMLNLGQKLVLFDVREVSYVSSVGIGALTQCAASLAGAGGRLAVLHGEGMVDRLFRLTHMEKALSLYTDEAAAWKSFVR